MALTALAFPQSKTVGWSMGYYTNWTNTNNYPFSKINWKAYTHVTYFSAIPNGSGGNLANGVSDADAKKFTDLCHQNNSKALADHRHRGLFRRCHRARRALSSQAHNPAGSQTVETVLTR